MNIKLIASALLAITLSSCGTKKESGADNKTVKPASTSISGYLSNYLEVVDGNYTAEKNNDNIWSWVIKVKIKAKKPYKSIDKGLTDGNDGPLYLDFADSTGAPNTDINNLMSVYTDDSKLAEILKKGEGEVWVTFTRFHVNTRLEHYPDNISAFTINSKKIEDESTSSSISSSDESSSTLAEAGDGSIDEMLDSYDKNTDDYVSMIESMSDDDVPGTISGYADLLKSTTDLELKLKDVKGKMSTTQTNRMIKIQTKMMKAIAKSNTKEAKKK